MRLFHFNLAIGILFAVAAQALAQTSVPSKATPEMFKPGYDIPAGIPHGTWDFDEWPGVDHAVVYKQNYMYNSTPNEKVKIDYQLSVFDKDDHEGYLKTPGQLSEHGFTDFTKVLRSTKNKTMVGIFTHPDDEVLLAGGLLAAAAEENWKVKAYLISNGSDGSEGQSDDATENLGGYNAIGVMPDGSVMVKTDVMGVKKLEIIRTYAAQLGVPVEVMTVDVTVLGKRLVQLGEVPGLDFTKTFGTGSEYRRAIYEAVERIINDSKPSIVLTHGTDGEYGNLMHKYAGDIVREIASEKGDTRSFDVYSCFPEYNISDHITHFIDLSANNYSARNKKWNAIKNISFLFKEGSDFDKPWDPNDSYMDGVFVKDYGYDPTTAEPPRYEFFQKLSFKNK
jgi:LmbE family N-acetylglucosaminyl deacetylase